MSNRATAAKSAMVIPNWALGWSAHRLANASLQLIVHAADPCKLYCNRWLPSLRAEDESAFARDRQRLAR
jgi:hypothetical protein